MRSRITTKLALFLLVIISAVSARPAMAQTSTKADDQKLRRYEVGADYSYVRSNAPPGGCTCFNLNGANGTFLAGLGSKGSFAIVGDVGFEHGSGISSSGYTLTMTTFAGGVRYRLPVGAHDVQPYGQALAGIAHTSGTLVAAPSPGATNAGAAFAAIAGAGLDMPVNDRLSIHLIEADYLLTTFDNAANNKQNNLRITAGIVFHF